MDTNSPAALFSLTYYYYRKLLASFLAVSLKVFKKNSIILITSNLQTYTWSTSRVSIKKMLSRVCNASQQMVATEHGTNFVFSNQTTNSERERENFFLGKKIVR